MAFVIVNPRYGAFLRSLSLSQADHFLTLPGVVIGGHPDRHVLQLSLGAGVDKIGAFLKREHRVPWKERLASALAGFGPVSKSCREAVMLQMASRAGIGCPEWMAAGEDDHGRAFLLTRELSDAVELRAYLRDELSDRHNCRRTFLRSLGEALARLHDAGFVHPDLYSKHVLVHPDDGSIVFLDWQRSRQKRSLTRRQRWRDLSCLHATLADDLALPRERLACLAAYLRASRTKQDWTRKTGQAASSINRLANRMLNRRRIREFREQSVPTGSQHLIWLDGEALCVTHEFQAAFNEYVPEYLRLPEAGCQHDTTTLTTVSVGDQRQGFLVRRQASRLLATACVKLRRRRLTSPELEKAGILFRLERYGLHCPRLLAVGQRQFKRGKSKSFLLTALRPEVVSLADWLRMHSNRQHADCVLRWHVLSAAGTALRRIGAAGCEITDWRWVLNDLPEAAATALICVQLNPESKFEIVLGCLESLRACHGSSRRRTLRGLIAALRALSFSYCTRTDISRFFLAYLDIKHVTPQARRLLQQIQRTPFRVRLRRLLRRPSTESASRKPEIESRQPRAEWSAAS
jgi:tRNA A-37 threonylcarbamoyl transferase component Bud32